MNLKAIEILKKLNKAEHWEDYYPSKYQCNEAIEELEELIKKDKIKNCEECYNKTKVTLETIKENQ